MRARLDAIFQVAQQGDHAEALRRLEQLRDEVPAAGIDRSTYLQTLAAVLDRSGRSADALAPAREAYAIDRDHDPAGVGAYLSLRTLIIVLGRIGQRAEAALRFDELLAVGEALGGMHFAGAVAIARGYLDADRMPALLARARHHCEVVLREEDPAGHERVQLASTYATIASQLAATYTDPDRAGDVLRAAIQVVRPIESLAPLERQLAETSRVS